MKIAIVKRGNNLTLPKWNRYIPFEEAVERKKTILDTKLNEDTLCLWGFIYGLKCDFFMEGDYPVDMAQYDAVITLEAVFTKSNKPSNLKKTCYFNLEPLGWGNSNVFSTEHTLSGLLYEISDVNNPKISGNYDFFLNSFITESTNRKNVPFWWRYLIDEMQLRMKNKISNKIYMNDRTLHFHVKSYSAISSLLVSEFEFLCDDWSNPNRTYGMFYEDLSTCSYQINLDNSISVGSTIAEASILGVITLGRKCKLFSKLLLPEYCLVEDLEEALIKVRELMSNEALRKQVLQQIQNSLYKIDYANLEKDFSEVLKRG